jgi:hypothetical protein
MKTVARRDQTGAATLLVVLMLFFIMALAGAYTSRNLIFEQKTSANHYRATQANEVALAGIHWALAMLNGGRVDAQCLPTADTASSPFRERYLEVSDTGQVSRRNWIDSGQEVPFTPSCLRSNAGALICSCPEAGAPSLTPPDANAYHPAFRIVFDTLSQPGMVSITSTGCSRWNQACSIGQGTTTGDAAARVTVVAALARGLPTSGAAALTLRGSLSVPSAELFLNNTDAGSGGLSLVAGGSVTAPNLRAVSPAGSVMPAAFVENDAALASASATQMFVGTFNMQASTYQAQAGAVRISDCTSNCVTKLLQTAAQFPRRTIWVDSDMVIDADLTLGTNDEPVLLVVRGSPQFTATNVVITGVLYTRTPSWSHSGSNAIVVGAAMAEGSFEATTPLTIHYDAQVQQRVHARFGTLVPVPGSWRDY